jgi:hypothetical protein
MGLLDKLREKGLVRDSPPQEAPTLKIRGESFEKNELLRIISMPICNPMDATSLEAFNRSLVLADAFSSGFRLFEPQANAIHTFLEHGSLFAPISVGWGKSECGDTEIFDAIKGRRRVDEFDNDLLVASKNDAGKIVFKKAKSYLSGYKRCVRLILKSGQSVGLSLDHPVFTSRGWVNAGELMDDDLIASPRSIQNPSPIKDIPDEEVELVAFLLADGGLSQGNVVFTDDNEKVLSRFEQIARSCGGMAYRHNTKSKATRINCQNLLPLTRKWGIQGFKSVDKRLPATWYRLPDRQVALFLNRFWSCDGHVDFGKGPHKLECTLSSEGLVRDLKFLFCRLGIQARSHYKKAKCGGRLFDSWRLTIAGAEVEKFLRIVGIPLGQDERCSKFNWVLKRNPNMDVVPLGQQEIREIAVELGIPKTPLLKRFGATQGQYISRSAFSAWVEEVGYTGKYAWLATNDLIWERIKSITSIGSHPVYDLSVEETHNFIGNGIVLHNSLISLVCANLAYLRGDHKIILFIPPQVYGQLTLRDIPWARRRVNLAVPFYGLGRLSAPRRKAIVASGRPGCYIFPYSLLSTMDSVELIDSIQPSLIIADEAHYLKNSTAARTKRVMRYISEKRPRLVCLSGTITSKGIGDYHHLIRASLRDNCPLPQSPSICADWSLALDASVEQVSSALEAMLKPLRSWAAVNWPKERIVFTKPGTSGIRKSYQKRLISCPGVVATGDAEIGTSLVIQNLPAARIFPPALEALMKKVTDEFLTPNGDEIEHAIHTFKWLYELSAGFYNELVWPDPKDFAHRRGISEMEAKTTLGRAREHHKAEQEYNSALRKFLNAHPPKGLELPMSVGAEIARGGTRVPGSLARLWHRVRELDFAGRPDRDSRVVRVDPYKINLAVKWAKEHRRGIIWVHHQELGRWAVEALRGAGIDALDCPAGDAGGERIANPKNRDRVCVASMSAHGTGKNLQHFQDQIFLQWPRPAKDAEQTIGRTHRNGQEADELIVHTTNTSQFDHVVFAACLNDSVYVQQTTGDRRKILFASYDPLPKIFSQSFLTERGMQQHRLSSEQEKILLDKFTGDSPDPEL